MNVAFVTDPGNADGTLGGAELTMRELEAAAPEDVEITAVGEADRVVVGNCTTFRTDLIPQLDGKPAVWFHNDLSPHNDRGLKAWLDEHAIHTFCSDLHRDRYALDGHLVPPPVDLDRFRPPRKQRRHGERSGTVAVGAWQNPGKGQRLLAEWAADNGPVDVFGPGGFIPGSPDLTYQGVVDQDQLPAVLWGYQRMVHLPTDPEPFGRAVVEAWAAGCDIVTNRNVGAIEWLDGTREGLITAAADFWRIVLGKDTA